MTDLVRRGEATIGLRYDRITSRDVDCDVLFAEPLQVVCSPRHVLAGRRVAKLTDLRTQRWIAFPQIPGRREVAASHVSALFLTHGLDDIAWTPVDSLTAQKRLVEANFGIALLSESHVADELDAGAISTIGVDDLAAAHEIVSVIRRGGFLSAASRRLLEIIRSDYKGTQSARRGQSLRKRSRTGTGRSRRRREAR